MKTFANYAAQHRPCGRTLLLIALGLGIGVGPIQGQTISFFRQFNTPGIDRAIAVTADESGIYVVGNRPDPDTAEGSAGLRKYDSLGNELWTRELSVAAGGSVTLVRAAADATGVYVLGYMPNPSEPSGELSIGFVRKYSAGGDELWNRQLDFFLLGSVTADASGVYVAGGDFPFNFSYLRKYSPDGAELWTSRFGDPDDLYTALGLAVDATGVYMVGRRWQAGSLLPFARKWDSNGRDLWNRQLDPSSDFLVGAAVDSTGFYGVADNGEEFTLSKHDIGGNKLWSRQINSGSLIAPDAGGSYNPGLIAADATGVYVVGRTSLAGPGMPGQCKSGSGGDSFVSKYSPDGVEVWTREFGASQASWASSVAVDASGVYVVGAEGTAQVRTFLELVDDFPTQNPTSDAFVAKFEKSSAAATESRPRILPDCVVNAASYIGGGVAPGEIVTIFGSAMGPSELVPLDLTEDNGTFRLATMLDDTRILFNEVPAPLLYSSDKQIGGIVPYAVVGESSVDIQVEYKGVRSDVVTVPVLASRPGIFSLDASGQGQGAILNEDGTLNSPSNPAQRGSIVAIYATGGGETAPGIVDGEVFFYTGLLPMTSLPVSVSFFAYGGGYYPEPSFIQGEVLYAGGVSGSVAGLLQLNVRVPPDAPSGDAVDFAVVIGSHWTLFQVTMALR